MRMRGGRMIVNPVRYVSGNKLTTITATRGVSSIYFTTNGVWSPRNYGGTFEADAGSICVIAGSTSVPPATTGMTLKTTLSSSKFIYQVDA